MRFSTSRRLLTVGTQCYFSVGVEYFPGCGIAFVNLTFVYIKLQWGR